jgi:hypothetical protein
MAPRATPPAPSRVALGTEAEEFVCANVPCPSCTSPLRPLPGGYPLLDVECTGCLFRAQVKRVKMKPRSRLRGGSWGPVDVWLKTGFLLPPMLVCFDWPAGEAGPGSIYLFPLVPKKNVKRRRLSEAHKTAAGRVMTEYVDMLQLPYTVVYERSD